MREKKRRGECVRFFKQVGGDEEDEGRRNDND
jgi:hypothetical protein